MRRIHLDGKKIYRAVLILGLFAFISTFIYYVIETKNNTAFQTDKIVTPVSGTANTGKTDLTVDYGDNLIVVKEKEDVHKGDLILVNNSILYHFPINESVASVFFNKSTGYKVRDKEVLLKQNVTNAINVMFYDFNTKFKNDDVTVVSGYRTYEYQAEVFRSKAALVGEAKARVWAAEPGGSEHHTGLALDISIYTDNGENIVYDGTGDYAWINENSYKYGLILRYTEEKTDITGFMYEPWHFRYVGLPHAYYITQNGLCLEEYIDLLRSFTFEGIHLQVVVGETVYEIYYQEASEDNTAITIPKSCESYEISGNNVDGFIVTLKYNKY
ncbi:MAG: D-alanyl-D-alanine carboxypeptidase [Clostridiales bacterium]|jgi:D-alanyl-D-alanine carboxypeptidase|nr:D-alanyl-D-alanine carboxypeptidase [Clostridiales bacterium]